MAKGQLSPDNTTMSFAIPKKLKEELGVVASRENRSMSNLLCILADHYISFHDNQELLNAYYELVAKAKSEEI